MIHYHPRKDPRNYDLSEVDKQQRLRAQHWHKGVPQVLFWVLCALAAAIVLFILLDSKGLIN